MKKRKDGRYKKNIYIGKDDSGKKRYKTIYGYTIKDLNEAEYRLRLEMHKRFDMLADDRLRVWADAFLLSQEGQVTPSELSINRSRAQYICAFFGDASIRSIRPVDVQRLAADLARENPATGKPSARRTIARYISLLSRIYRYAIDNRAADYDPAANVSAPRTAAVSTRRALTKEERKRIEEFEHPAQLAMMLMLYSGLRRGEAGALLWSDIDLENRTIIVTKSMDYKQGVIKAPKNGRSRVVSIPIVLADFLKNTPHTADLVVVSRSGRPMTESAWKRMLESYLRDMNVQYAYSGKASKCRPGGLPMLIEPFTFHCLRHTFCTMLYEAGVDVLVAQEQMGHSDVKTTLAIYTHLSQEHKAHDIRKLDDFLQNGNAPAEADASPKSYPQKESEK